MENNVAISYLSWHFYEAPKFLVKVWKNYINFSLNYFSTSLLLKTLFSPWRRYAWGYPKGFDVKVILENFVSNIISRVLGAIVRLFLIIAGAFVQVGIFLGGAILIAIWILLPLICLGGLLFSFGLI